MLMFYAFLPLASIKNPVHDQHETCIYHLREQSGSGRVCVISFHDDLMINDIVNSTTNIKDCSSIRDDK